MTAYILLPGGTGDYVDTPDADEFDITGDIDVRLELGVHQQSSGAFQMLHAKYSASNISWWWQVTPTGSLGFSTSPDGTSASAVSGVNTNTPLNLGRSAYRATLDVDNGAGGRTGTLWVAPRIFELCDRNLRPIGELHPDRASTASINVDTSSNVARKLSGLKLTPDEAADVNPVRDRLRVYMGLQNDEEFLLGTFLWSDDSRPRRSWGVESSSSLTDYSFILSQRSTRAYSFERNGNIGLGMFFLLFQAGFSLEDIAHIGHEAARGLAEPVAWQPGTSWVQMLTDLGKLVGFTSPWFDRYGRLHFDVPPDPSLSGPTVPTYDEEPSLRVIADSIVETSDILAAPNDFAVTDSGTDRLRVGRYQIPASAEHSYANRGFRIGAVEQVQGLGTQAQADEAAKKMVATEGLVYATCQFSSTADPRHDVYDIVEILGQRWLETAWSMKLESGAPMDHTLRRTIYDG